MKARHQFVLTDGQLTSLKEHGVINQVVLKQTAIWGPGKATQHDLDFDRAEAQKLGGLHYLQVPYIKWGEGAPEKSGALVPRWAVGDVLEAFTPSRNYEATLEVLSVVPKRTEYGWDWVISVKEFAS